MKKLVALAVAGAFIAPVYAADVAITGYVESSYLDQSNSTSSTKQIVEDGQFIVSASGETAFGIKVSARIGIESDGSRNDGGGLTLSGSFGRLVIGDTNGAVDSLDAADFTLVTPGMGLGGRADAAIGYTLPTFAPGLSVYLAYTPEDGVEDELAGTANAQVEGVAVKYSFGPAVLKFAVEDVGAASNTYFGLTYKIAGVGFAYDSNEGETAGVKTDWVQYSLTYGMGDTTLAVGNNSAKPSGADKTSDVTAFGIHQNLGGGVTAFLETSKNDNSGKAEATAIGVSFKF